LWALEEPATSTNTPLDDAPQTAGPLVQFFAR
jgi:hypothetical protein